MNSIPEIKRGDELRLTIDDAAFEGKTVSRVDGFVVFVEGGVPGDLVNARITKVKKSYAEASVLSIEKASPLRVAPRCQYFGTCGGCKWQHVDYAAQLQFKQQHVVDAFERIGGFRDLPMVRIIGADEISAKGARQPSVGLGYASGIYFYRNKMEFSFSTQEWTDIPPQHPREKFPPSERTSSGVELPHSSYYHSPFTIHHSPRLNAVGGQAVFLGLHVPQRYDKVLDIHECHLQSDHSNQILNFTRDFARRNALPVYNSDTESGYLRFLVIRQSTRTNELMVNLVTFDDRPEILKQYTRELQTIVPSLTTVVNTINSKKAQIAYGEMEKTYLGTGVIHEQLGKHTFTISASSFFQTNTGQAEKLYSVAKLFAELQSTDTVWDLYSGTGSIALFISDSVRQVIGIESVESAVRDAERNAKANGVQNCSFILGDLKDRLTKETGWMSSHPKPDVIIIDPPRSGMHPKVVDEILEIAPSRIVYVSCNPTTQARDLKLLCTKKYELVKLQPVDMFPHTYHIENVALLRRR